MDCGGFWFGWTDCPAWCCTGPRRRCGRWRSRCRGWRCCWPRDGCRAAGWACRCVCRCCGRRRRAAAGGVWFTLLDVGQGLAAVVRTQQPCVGLRYRPEAWGRRSTPVERCSRRFCANRARFGWIRSWSATPTSQHTGGVRSLRELMPVERILTASLEQTPMDGRRTVSGRSEVGVGWGAVSNPASARDRIQRDDNASCVLRVEGAAGRVLLPGDIETAAETALLATYGTLDWPPKSWSRRITVIVICRCRRFWTPCGLNMFCSRPAIATGSAIRVQRPWRAIRRPAQPCSIRLRRRTDLSAGAGSAADAGTPPTRRPSLLDRALMGGFRTESSIMTGSICDRGSTMKR
jgi:hypothetical protein